jgi:G3E family GTPase
MQNGCFCCTLQNDLVEQIKELAAKKMFNYMLIEASGVSEPSQIAPLFELCEDEHDPDNPDHEHSEGPELAEVARLDTCITVVDAAEFYNNLDSMKVSLKKSDYSSLLLLNRSVLSST